MASHRPPNSDQLSVTTLSEDCYGWAANGRGEVPAKSVPAWILSMLLHAIGMLVVAFVFRVAPRGVVPEPERTTGIALVQQDAAERHYSWESDESNSDEESASAALDRSLSEVLPPQDQLEMNLDGVLPTASGDLVDAETDRYTDVDDSTKDGERHSLASGDATTSVFGVEGTGSRFVYVFDRSGSMDGFGGAPLRAAKAELLSSLNDLQRGHQFQIIFYNEQPRVFNPTGGEPSLVWGDEAGKQLAKRFVTGIAATGGTRHMHAMRLALGMRPDVIFFLTDADEPQMTEDELGRVRRLNYATAIHAIEFGYGPNRSTLNFLKRLAAENRGRHVYIDVAKLRKRAS